MAWLSRVRSLGRSHGWVAPYYRHNHYGHHYGGYYAYPYAYGRSWYGYGPYQSGYHAVRPGFRVVVPFPHGYVQWGW